jgi:hypothetical protein
MMSVVIVSGGRVTVVGGTVSVTVAVVVVSDVSVVSVGSVGSVDWHGPR